MTATKNSLRVLPSIEVQDSDFETETTYSRVYRTICSPSDVSAEDQMHIVEASGTLGFWNDPSEDIYSGNDDDAI